MPEDALMALPGVLARVQRNRPFRLDAWVALPDRLDCIWTLPTGDLDVAGRWRAIRRGLADAVGPGLVRWQPARAALPVTGMTEYADLVRRCWFAPVRRGLVARPEDWAFSSIHRESTAAV
ncbi:MAG: hypothetical protein KDK24_14925 [Pseudooceanicola sp.]|nr:hypothetical protein [Pseudooceanicola sp.]